VPAVGSNIEAVSGDISWSSSDLVNSTEIAAHLDPEEWHEILASYHRATSDAVAQFGGHVAQYLGEGVMAFFGLQLRAA
jgi:class 3 adenylate cyclase